MSFPWTTLWVGLVALAPFARSQQPQLHREIPEDAFGTRELIVWSGVQKPPPAPPPFPAPDNQTRPPDQQSGPPAVPHTQQTPAQSFSGWIVRDGERFYEKVKKVKADVAALHICFSFRRVLEGWRAVKGGADRQRSS